MHSALKGDTSHFRGADDTSTYTGDTSALREIHRGETQTLPIHPKLDGETALSQAMQKGN